MINITYEEWLDSCNMIKKYAKGNGKYYLQLYPFYKYNNFKYLSSETYFLTYVKSGAIFANYDNFDTIDNYCQKDDGRFRKRLLISPIMYIYFILL